jgi:hypothetical protein
LREKMTNIYCYAILLQDEVKTIEYVANRNPDAHLHMPCVYIATTSKRPPANSDGLRGQFRLKLLKRHAIEVCKNTVSRHLRLEGALSQRDVLVEEYRNQGWSVANADPERRCSTYVIELEELNKTNTAESAATFYVGQTGLTPEKRFEQHKNGIHANKQVEKFGVRLRLDLVITIGQMTHLESLREERQTAKQLRNKGYRVLGGH